MVKLPPSISFMPWCETSRAAVRDATFFMVFPI